MSTPQTTKPIFKAPEQKPFKMAEPELEVHNMQEPPIQEQVKFGWKLIATAPQEAEARFMVRATAGGKGINGTETLVRYRASRKMVGGKWKPALIIIDDKLGIKLGFRPTEWTEIPVEK